MRAKLPPIQSFSIETSTTNITVPSTTQKTRKSSSVGLSTSSSPSPLQYLNTTKVDWHHIPLIGLEYFLKWLSLRFSSNFNCNEKENEKDQRDIQSQLLVSGSFNISEYHGGERENNIKDLLNANDNENDSYSRCQDFMRTARQQKTLADF